MFTVSPLYCPKILTHMHQQTVHSLSNCWIQSGSALFTFQPSLPFKHITLQSNRCLNFRINGISSYLGMSYSNSKGSDHPAHLCSLTRNFSIYSLHHLIKNTQKVLMRLNKCADFSGPLLPICKIWAIFLHFAISYFNYSMVMAFVNKMTYNKLQQ